MPVLQLTVGGVPAHPLVVHAVVVGVPVMALLGIAIVVRAGWRDALAWPVAAGNSLLVVVSLLARTTGEGLVEQLGGNLSEAAAEHTALGDVAPLWVLPMALTGVGFAWLRRRGRAWSLTTGILLVLSSLAGAGFIVVVGHAGATATWGWVGG